MGRRNWPVEVAGAKPVPEGTGIWQQVHPFQLARLVRGLVMSLAAVCGTHKKTYCIMTYFGT
jgi:hypothetical protein